MLSSKSEKYQTFFVGGSAQDLVIITPTATLAFWIVIKILLRISGIRIWMYYRYLLLCYLYFSDGLL